MAVVTRPPTMTAQRPLGVGIVANEFFDLELGRMGGFGWNALHAARALRSAPGLDARPVFISGEHRAPLLRPWRPAPTLERQSNGFPLIVKGRPSAWKRELRSLGLDLLLTIEYRVQYEAVLSSLPETPVVVWIRDPRPPADLQKIATLAIPGDPAPPQGVGAIDASSMRRVYARAGEDGRAVVFASPAPGFLGPKASDTYGIPALPVEFLPSPIDVIASRWPQSRRPTAVFLGRLDPIKRPWRFAELARQRPHVDFLMLGQAHYSGPGSSTDWLQDVPSNLRLCSHVDGDEKERLLSSAWVVVNTSIHEALATSLVEALHYGVPIVSCQDPEGIASRFGVYVGRYDGNGMESLPRYLAALDRLLDDSALRTRLGEEGRLWARANHTKERFVEEFVALAGRLLP